MASKSVIVVGAGAFGGWTALKLRERGADVLLVDAWGPGHARASSGGETRVLRAIYGDRRLSELARIALDDWCHYQVRWQRPLFVRTGVLWLVTARDELVRQSLPHLHSLGLPFTEMDVATLERRYPQLDASDVRWAVLEHEAGFLLARQACQAVVQAFIALGGTYKLAQVTPGTMRRGTLEHVRLAGGTATLTADQYVFACGAWLGEVFPDVVGARISPTRQEEFFFGTPPGDARFGEEALPVFIDWGDRIRYGIPGNDLRGVKIGDDQRGPRFDPTHGERDVAPAAIAAARAFLARRLPELAHAPLVETRVCPYEDSPDGGFLIDRHPDAENVWLLGGGSGHGFKHGPALGAYAAALVLGERAPEEAFALRRFAAG